MKLIHSFALAFVAALSAVADPVPLFNGTSFDGWEGETSKVWRIQDSVIVGGSLEGNPRNEFLATRKSYRNFVLRLEYRLVGREGFVNGGVQFRSKRIGQPAIGMAGFQADIGAGYSGCLIDESRRRQVLATADSNMTARIEKPGDWNRYEIRADGGRIQLSINGVTTVNYTEQDPRIETDGVIGLQIHGDCKAEISFRNITIEELPGDSSPPKPNFILINIDDLGYADIGPFGSTLNRTPHLDRMAREGRKLTSFYAAPVCSPSRAALMTGCYPKRALPIPHVLFPGNDAGLAPGEVTVAEVLKDEGYATGIVGKWHLGDQPEFLPTRQGFDEWFGLPYSNDMGPAEDGVKSDLGKPLPVQKGNGKGQPPLPLLRNGKVIKRVLPDDQQSLVELYTEEALSFITRHQERPFFLYLPHNAVHFPIYPGKKWAGQSANGIYSDWVEEVDWSVGRVLDTVRAQGLAERTLVIFTSDNGGTPRGLNRPLRGHKGSTWEGGMRACTIAWWPGKIPAGTTSDAITGMFDVLPTFAALGGGKVPTDRRIDGANLWPILAGEPNAKPPHETFYFYRGLRLEGVRHGDWKLLRLPDAPAAGDTTPPKPALYNLKTDVGESMDVAAAHPEVVAKLEALIAAMKEDLGLEGPSSASRPLGKAASAAPMIDHEGKVREELGGGLFGTPSTTPRP